MIHFSQRDTQPSFSNTCMSDLGDGYLCLELESWLIVSGSFETALLGALIGLGFGGLLVIVLLRIGWGGVVVILLEHFVSLNNVIK